MNELVNGELVFRYFHTKNRVPVTDNRDVRPSQQVLVVGTDREASLMQWGLVPSWSKDAKLAYSTFNARAEGIQHKASFKGPLRSQRVIIPASAFFEWSGKKGHKTKYRIARRDAALLGFAGLYDTWVSPEDDELKSCTIITTAPNKEMAAIHDRMPVILLEEDLDAWLNPDLTEPQDILPYLLPYPDDLLTVMRAA